MSTSLRLNKSSTSTILMMLIAFFLTGCSHRNLVKAGQQHIASGHYELAVEQFEQALIEKPNHQPTSELLTSANRNLQLWASQLAIKADQAKKLGYNGKAMLLYSKVAQLTKSPDAIIQYKKIYQQIRQKSALKVNLQSNNLGIVVSDLTSISGLILDNSDSSVLQLAFSQSNPVFEIQQSSNTKTTQFISGYQMIANPELIEIQHQIRHLQNNNHQLRDTVAHSNHQLSDYNVELTSLNQQLQSINQQLLRTNLAVATQQQYRAQLSQVQLSINRTTQQASHTRAQHNKYRHQLSHDRNELSHLISQLATTVPVVSVPVYTDYHYPVKHQRNSLTTQLYLTLKQTQETSTRVAKATVVSQDDSHPAHPTIALAADPMHVKNQQQLSPLLKIELKNRARRLLNELIDEQRHQFIRQANQTINIEQKFSLWINHGMVSEDGALPDIVDKVRQTLVMEYGVGGEFNINQLLHRY